MESDIFENIKQDIYSYSDERESIPVIFSMLKRGTYHSKGIPITYFRENQLIDWRTESLCCFYGNWRQNIDSQQFFNVITQLYPSSNSQDKLIYQRIVVKLKDYLNMDLDGLFNEFGIPQDIHSDSISKIFLSQFREITSMDIYDQLIVIRHKNTFNVDNFYRLFFEYRISIVKLNLPGVGGHKNILIRDNLNNIVPINFYYNDVNDRSWNNRNDWCEFQATPRVILDKLTSFHTRKWLPTILINLFVGSPIDQYKYNLKLKGYMENIYHIKDLTFSDLHSAGLSIESLALNFARSQYISMSKPLKRLLISNFKPSIIPKIHISDEDSIFESIRKEHTMEILVKDKMVRDYNLWDYWTYPTRILYRFSNATGHTELDKIFNNIIRHASFKESWFEKTNNLTINEAMDVYNHTYQIDRLESIYKIYSRSAKTILKMYQSQQKLVSDIFSITGSRKDTINIVNRSINECERDLNLNLNTSIVSNFSNATNKNEEDDC